MTKKVLFYCSFLMILSFSLFAQSAGRIDEILESESLTKGQACYLLGCISGVVDTADSYDFAFSKYQDLKMFKDENADEDIRLDEFSYLVVSNLNAKSLWWKATKRPHYALRYLKKSEIVDIRSLAGSYVKPVMALNLLSRLSDDFISKDSDEEIVPEENSEDTKAGGENE